MTMHVLTCMSVRRLLQEKVKGMCKKTHKGEIVLTVLTVTGYTKKGHTTIHLLMPY